MLHRHDKRLSENRPHLVVLFFDRYNAEDPLFVADVARRLAAASKNGIRSAIVHDSGDAADRVRESALSTGGPSNDETDAMALAISMANQSITRRMIDEGVSAVSVQGNARGLLSMTKADAVETGNVEWLERAIGMGGIPVISLLADAGEGRSVPVDAAAGLSQLLRALSQDWEVTLLLFTTNRKSGLFSPDGQRLELVDIESIGGFSELSDVASKLPTDRVGAIYATNSAGLGTDGSISGTLIN